MTTILLVVLFISQLLTFYFLVILNSKLSKYKEIEKKQEAIIREMDNAISVYLLEVKDENDRLIKELKKHSEFKKTVQGDQHIATESSHFKIEAKTDDSIAVLENETLKSQNLKLEQKENQSEQVIDAQKFVSKTVAATAYKKQLPPTQPQIEQNEKVVKQIEQPEDQGLSQFEQEVVNYHRLGMTIEEIAKKTQKGKTEIELLIKFHA